MRPGEYLALRWEDVNLREKVLIVQQGVWQLTRADVRITGVKSHRSERALSITDDEVALLREECRLQERQRAAAGEQWEAWGLAFADATGRPLDQYRLRREFGKLLKRAELPTVRLYTLRKTMASIMHAMGVPPKVIAARLGHVDAEVTFRYYIKEFEAQDRAAAEALSSALRSGEGTRMGHDADAG